MTVDQHPSRLSPRMSGLASEFYQWVGAGELRFQHCRQCGSWQHLPRPACRNCGSAELAWDRSEGRGTVWSWTTTHRPILASFPEVPYASVVVELAEGPRLLTNVIDVAPEDLRIGQPVEVVFQPISDEWTAPLFRAAPRPQA
jgi:uncharacterized OB-fold protein